VKGRIDVGCDVTMKIEIFYFEGCPNYEPTVKLVQELVSELHIDAEITAVNVEDNDDAVSKRFLGSPSIRIKGKDIEMEENELTQYSMRCRVYQYDGKYSGLPSREVLRRKLIEALE